MLYFARKCWGVTVVFVVIVVASLIQNPTLALAKERKPMKAGVSECKAWCDRNNKTVASQHACYVNCEKYWLCQGSDATASTCADGKALGLEQSPPSNPTPNTRKPTAGTKAPAASSN